MLRKEIQDYIRANINTDLPALLLRKSPFADISIQEIAQQVKGLKVAQRKFPFLLKEGIQFPPGLNLEQASSQSTAQFKACGLSGEKYLDLTSGFGIDAWFMSEDFRDITLVEQNRDLIDLVQHNWKILGRPANFVNDSLESFLKRNSERFDVVYLDPARRDQHKNKKFLLEDLSPNLLEIQEDLFRISDHIIIKLSPLIDISYLLGAVRNISKIQIIAVRNEVKELVLHLRTDAAAVPLIEAINLESREPSFGFKAASEAACSVEYSEPEQFLYLPNTAVLKSGAFNLIASRFNLKKLHPNTHLYTSAVKVDDFPGRVMQVDTVEAKSIKKGGKFNIVSKNYPLTPDQIRKKYKISDGGSQYLIFTQSVKGKIILKSS